jgi:hypothetical protein
MPEDRLELLDRSGDRRYIRVRPDRLQRLRLPFEEPDA